MSAAGQTANFKSSVDDISKVCLAVAQRSVRLSHQSIIVVGGYPLEVLFGELGDSVASQGDSIEFSNER